MKAIVEKLHSIGGRAWLRFVQSLNGLTIALLGGALVVHQNYPTVFTDLLGPIPTPAKAALLFGFGTVVHYALGRVKADGK